jgi:signal transduction histidine kinase
LDRATGRCVRYLEREGFPSSWVYGILQDDEGRLWLSTNAGLVLFDDRQAAGDRFVHFDHRDGLAGDEFNRRSHVRRRNGEMLFGGPNGVTRFFPEAIRGSRRHAPVVLKAFHSLGKRVHFDRDIADVTLIELSPYQNAFSFQYTALSFWGASRQEYQYMLEGLDNDWIRAGVERSVQYAYVPPGEYVFRVRGANGDGARRDPGVAVRLVIHPPFWTRWWFIALSALAVGLAAAAIVRARVRRMRDMELLRTRIARDLHDEIGSNLSSIAMRSEMLQRQSALDDRERKTLNGISSVALTTLNDMKDIVWLIRPGNDALDDLFLRMKDTAASLLEGREYRLTFPAEPVDRRIGLEWKQNVYLLYKEALTNIARHSGATSADIEARVEANRLMLRIRDDGAGFDPAGSSAGNGLRNMRERAGLIGASLDIQTRPGEGTTVSLAARIT